MDKYILYKYVFIHIDLANFVIGCTNRGQNVFLIFD